MSVTFNEAAMFELLNSVNGPVGRRIQQAGNTTVRAARRMANGERVQVQTGQYIASFNTRMTAGSGGRSAKCEIYNTAPHAIIIEQGSRPHEIETRNRKVLYNPGTGTFFGRTVNHPGTKPRRILQDALQEAVRNF